jgi:hypothetical protein
VRAAEPLDAYKAYLGVAANATTPEALFPLISAEYKALLQQAPKTEVAKMLEMSIAKQGLTDLKVVSKKGRQQQGRARADGEDKRREGVERKGDAGERGRRLEAGRGRLGDATQAVNRKSVTACGGRGVSTALSMPGS